MKAQFLRGAALVAFAFAACPSGPSDQAVQQRARAGGSLAIAADDSELYAADADNDELVVIDPSGDGKAKARVKVGRSPERVLVTPDGQVLVSNRHDRSVSLIDPASAKEIARIKVGAEPVGMALTGDGRLLVANNTQQTLSIVDLAKRQEIKQIPTRADPVGVTLVGDGKAYVTHARTGDVSVFDLGSESFSSNIIAFQLAPEKTAGDQRLPNTPVDPAYNPQDGRVYVPHQQSKLTPVQTNVDTPGGAYASGNGPVAVAVVANALATVDAASDHVVDAPGIDLNAGCPSCGAPMGAGGGGGDVPPVIEPAHGPMSGPSAIAIEPSGQWMFVTNMNSNNVSILPTKPRDFAFEPVRVGAGPNGIAITKNGDKAFVYNAFSHSISVLEAAGRSSVVAAREFKVGMTSLTPEQDKGRRLFFAADDARMTNSSAGGIACASCHPGGRDDGRTWQFSEGPRNTPMLSGRGLRDTAPYHWDGALNDMHAFKMVVETRMGGTGTQGGPDGALTADDFNAMMAYLDALPGPDNPNRGAQLTDAQARGKAIFESEDARCASCHKGESLQDNDWHDVGTAGQSETFPHDGMVNTPTLRNVFASAPYLHDGRDATLRDRIKDNPGDLHGGTSQLSDAQVDDLVAYLKTL